MIVSSTERLNLFPGVSLLAYARYTHGNEWSQMGILYNPSSRASNDHLTMPLPLSLTIVLLAIGAAQASVDCLNSYFWVRDILQ